MRGTKVRRITNERVFAKRDGRLSESIIVPKRSTGPDIALGYFCKKLWAHHNRISCPFGLFHEKYLFPSNPLARRASQYIILRNNHRSQCLSFSSSGYILKHMGDDGSCLFRAVADQVYGDQEMHIPVRAHCMDYIVSYYKSLNTRGIPIKIGLTPDLAT